MQNFAIAIIMQITLNRISIEFYPVLLRLKNDREEYRDLLKLGPEDFLIRWFNFQLNEAGYKFKLYNFGYDIKDSEKYIIIFSHLFPEICDKSTINISNLYDRAKKVLTVAKEIGITLNINENDIVNGNEELNILFVAEIFLKNNGMGEATIEEKNFAKEILDDDLEIIRRERYYRIWINSLKLEGCKKVNNLYEESRTGILLLKAIDKYNPGAVLWNRVEAGTKNPFKIGFNCQEVIDSSKRSGFNIISIGNKDIQEGRKLHILAIVWQLMRAYTLKYIGDKGEEELIYWGNYKVSQKRQIKNLKEKKLNNGLFWIELCASIEPKCINWKYVVKDNITDKDKEMNSKYAISASRALGACHYVSWKDITEVDPNILLTLLASLYYVAKVYEK